MMASLPRWRARLATRWAAARLRHRQATSLTQTMNREAIMLTGALCTLAISSRTTFGNRDANFAIIKINMLDIYPSR